MYVWFYLYKLKHLEQVASSLHSPPGTCNLKAKSKSIINISSRTQHYTRRICIFVPHAIATQSGSVEDHINWLISADAL